MEALKQARRKPTAKAPQGPTLAEVVLRLCALGVQARAEGGDLVLIGASRLSESERAAVKAHRDALLAGVRWAEGQATARRCLGGVVISEDRGSTLEPVIDGNGDVVPGAFNRWHRIGGE